MLMCKLNNELKSKIGNILENKTSFDKFISNFKIIRKKLTYNCCIKRRLSKMTF